VGNWDVEEDCWRLVEGGVDWTASQQLPKTDHHRDQSCNNYEEKALAVMMEPTPCEGVVYICCTLGLQLSLLLKKRPVNMKFVSNSVQFHLVIVFINKLLYISY
jgi:hypothetical protein